MADWEDAPAPAAANGGWEDAPAQQTVGGAVQAARSGLASAAPDVAGLPVDTAMNVYGLGQAAVGMAGVGARAGLKLPNGETMGEKQRYSRTPHGLYHYKIEDPNRPGDPLAATHDIYSKEPPADNIRAMAPWQATGGVPDASHEVGTSETPGGSDWFKRKGADVLAGGDPTLFGVEEDTAANRIIHGGAEAAPFGLVGPKGQAVRGVIGATTGGVTGQAAAEAGLGQTGAAIAGLAGNVAAGPRPEHIEAAHTAAHEPVPPSPGPALKPEEFAPKPPKPKITPKAGESAQAAAARQGITTEPPPPPAAPSASPGAKGTPAPQAVNDPSFFEAPDNQDLKAGAAGPEEQAARHAAVAQGAPTLQNVRDSAITNDYQTQGRDWTGKQAGDAVATAQIAAEGQALHSEAARISSETGGQLGTGESADAIRGKAYQDWHDSTVAALDKHIKDTYAAEDAEAKQYASPGSNLKGVLTDDSLIDNQNAGAVRSSTIALARKMGVDLTDPNAQLNGYQIENLRKHANATYGSAPRLAQAIKNAADADLPPQAYRRARALQKIKSDMFDNRDGINQLGPAKDGNRQVASPDVMKTIERMDPDQQGHIVNTMKRSASVLEGLGDHETAVKIAAKAHKAAQHLQSHFTERWIDEASKGGGWNTRRAHQFLKNNQETLSRVMTPEQMHQIRNVNNAANVLDLDKRYKGAFAQFAQGAGWLRRIGGTAALGTVEAGLAHATGGASVAIKEAANVASGGKIDKALNQLGTGGRSTPKGFTRPMGQSPAFRKQGGWVNIGGKMVPEPADFEGGEHVTQETPHEHFVDENGDHMFTTNGGQSWLKAEPTANNGLRVRGSYSAEKGTGAGGVLYQKAAEHATQNGGRFESDAIVSNDAARRWEELRRNGWDVKRDPNAKPTKNGLINEGDKPVFSTTGRVDRPTDRPLGARIGGGKQRGAVGNLTDEVGAKREEKQLQAFHTKFMGDVRARMEQMQKETEAAGHKYQVGDRVWGTKGDGSRSDPYTIIGKTTTERTLADHQEFQKAIAEGKPTPKFMGDRARRERNRAAGVPAQPAYFMRGPDGSEFTMPEWGIKGQFLGPKSQRGAVGNLANKGTIDMTAAEPREREAPATVNIGLHQGDPANGGRVMQPQEAVTALKQAGVKITKKTISEAGSEPTMVASLDRKLTPEEMQGVLAKTKQSAIPQRLAGGEGEMHVAPGHEETAAKEGWDKYNPDYFRMHDDRVATEHDAQNKAYAEIKPHLTPKEAADIESRGDTHRTAAIKNLLDTFHGSTSIEGVSAMALAGAAKKGWYAKAAKAINGVFGPDAPRFTALLAAMSPQTSVEMNFHNALRTFVNWDKAGRPQDAGAIKKIMEDSSLKNPESESESNVMDAWHQNGVRALTSKDPEHEEFQLSGPKVDSFHKNLRGHMHEVTNDSWNAIATNIDQKLFSGTYRKVLGDIFGRLGFKSPTYMGVSAKVRAAALQISKLTGEHWSPAEVQETMWSFVKTAFETAKATGKSIPELIKSGELNDELIRGTSDFHTLFGAPEHRGFLADSRFGAAAERVAGGQSESPVPARTGKARAAAAETLRPSLVSEAERLETARQARLANRKARIGNIQVPF